MVQICIYVKEITDDVMKEIGKYLEERFGRITICDIELREKLLKYNVKSIDYNMYLNNEWTNSSWGKFHFKIFGDDEEEIRKFNSAVSERKPNLPTS